MRELTDLTEVLRAQLDPIGLVQRVVDEALALVPAADGAAVELVDDSGSLTYVCAAGSLAAHVGTRLRADGSLSGLAIRSGQVQLAADVAADRRVDAAACRRLGVASMVCVPLMRQGEALGVLKLSSATPGALADAQLRLLASLAEFVSVTVGAVTDLRRVVGAMWRVPAQGAGATPAGVATFVGNVLAPQLTAGVAIRQRVDRLLAADGPRMVFQPIVALDDTSVVGFEALARFDDARPPDVWFAEATEAGCGVELEVAAVTAALRGFPAALGGYLSVNVSPATLCSPRLRDVVAAYGGGRPLVMELTEHAAVRDYPAALDGIRRLRELGVRIAIDDLGSGYASLRHVVDLRPDVLKIDRSLVSYLDEDPARYGLAAAFVQLGRSLDCTVLAEGVERPEELDTARRLGIGYAQGYLFGRPQAADVLLARLMTQPATAEDYPAGPDSRFPDGQLARLHPRPGQHQAPAPRRTPPGS